MQKGVMPDSPPSFFSLFLGVHAHLQKDKCSRMRCSWIYGINWYGRIFYFLDSEKFQRSIELLPDTCSWNEDIFFAPHFSRDRFN